MADKNNANLGFEKQIWDAACVLWGHFPGGDEVLTLPGQVMVNSDEVYRKTVCGKLPFIEILERIKLKLSTGNTAAAVSV